MSEKLAFEPLRFKSLVWGLSAEFSDDPKKKIMYLSLRLDALEQRKKVDVLRTSQKDIVMAKIRDYQRICDAFDSLKKTTHEPLNH